MTTLSSRITSISPGGDDGWGLFRRARAMKAAGLPVVELTIGEHDRRTDPAILAAMARAAEGGHTGYSEIPGTAALRRAVAERVAARTGVPTGPGNVLITTGGQGALFSALMAAMDPGGRALIVDPYYATYPGTVRAAGGVPVAVPALPDAGFLPDMDALRAAAPGARCLTINTPNNPTGRVYGRTVLEEIGAICAEHGLWLISDEVYDTQVWSGAHLSPRALPGLAERTIVVGSLSKSHAMTGSRVGWAVGPEAAVAAMTDLSTHTTYGIPGYVMDAGLAALGLGAEFEAGIAEPFRRRRAIVERVIGPSRLGLVPVEGAMYAMIDVRPTGLDGTAFAEALLEAERIAVMPGASFGAVAAGHVRLALTVADDALEEALGRMARFAGAL
ncbi:pyridoxal phosphate-dependent aminotransferase [Wenxinia saemankumensis]|uniref:Aminotransferase n=1 Tax=Wenxinia saemankumensis TaxID=1447782 RepID=A0A1M5ZZB3_9RHOB|nr:aminotransferase class I/II-fold pyridoxal phosphate-dependent enzyme [Wenxinia saemankumensis]SHI29486.1 arginine:pyruvate transaminase [Wenxinia saemankumensis]